jgi:hypothetical protein
MSAATASAPARPASGVLFALARFEARRLPTHPLFLAGLLVTAAAVVSATGEASGQDQTFLLSGGLALGLGVGTFLAANLAAMRTERGGSGELLEPLPRGAASRTAGQLVALLWTVPLAVAAVAIGYVAFGAGEGLVVDRFGTTRVPSLVELAQAPFAVLALGAAGVLLGRLAPTPLLAPLAVAGLLTLETVLPATRAVQWLLPFAGVIEFASDASVPCAPGDVEANCGVIAGFDTAAMAVHLVYLAGLTGVCSVAALSDRGRVRAAAAAAAAALAGLMLLAA